MAKASELKGKLGTKGSSRKGGEAAPVRTETKKRTAKSKTTGVVTIEELLKLQQVKGTRRVNVDGDVMELRNLDKVLWPDEGYTKLDLIRYYWSVRKTILPYLKDRPVIMKRYPGGIKEKPFYQHDLPYAPKFIKTVRIPSENHPAREYALVNDPGDLIYLVCLGTIAQNPFHARIKDRTKPDYFIFDLDPEAKATFDDVRFVALEVKKVLDQLGLKSYPKTSGSSGIHIYVPIHAKYSYDEVVDFAKGVAELVVKAIPDRATVIRWVKQRNPRHIYVDYLQNLNGKSIASAYSVREKPGAPVSTPLEWREVGRKFEITDFTIENTMGRLKKKGDLFKPVLTKRQSLGAPRKKLDALLRGR